MLCFHESSDTSADDYYFKFMDMDVQRHSVLSIQVLWGFNVLWPRTKQELEGTFIQFETG